MKTEYNQTYMIISLELIYKYKVFKNSLVDKNKTTLMNIQIENTKGEKPLNRSN